MAVSLSDLTIRLEGVVSARDGVPNDFAQLIKDAVTDFNQRAPMRKLVMLNMIANTATYDLPSDFVKLLTVQRLANASGVILSSQGIIPTDGSYTNERHTVAGLKITFYPTPTFAAAREVWYAAGHVLNGSLVYAEMIEQDAVIVLEKAMALALMQQADAARRESWSYGQGDERVDKKNFHQAFVDGAREHLANYERMIAAKTGTLKPIGMRASYEGELEGLY